MSVTAHELNADLLWPREGGRIVILLEPDAERRFAMEAVDRLVSLAGELSGMPVSLLQSTDAGFVDFSCTTKEGCTCPTTTAVDTKVSYLVVKFVQDDEPSYGWARTVPLEGSCPLGSVYRLVVNLHAINGSKMLRLTAARLETRALVHEYGHLLGLCNTDEHSYPHKNKDIHHCKRSECAMSGPTPKAKIYALFHTGFGGHNVDDYCKLCKQDIADAKLFWAQNSPGRSAQLR